jgi:hypothetical protein
MPYWTSSEAAALLAGYDPMEVGSLREYDDDSVKIDRFRIAIERAIESGDLAGQPNRILPYDLVCWAFPLSMHQDPLFWAVLKHRHQDTPGSVEATEIDSLIAQNARLKRELALQQGQPAIPALPPAQSAADTGLGERERTTFLKMILGMAIKKYRYKINQNNGASGQISHDLATLGISVSDDTIREKLSEAGGKIEANHQKDI